MRSDPEPILKRQASGIIKLPELLKFCAWDWNVKGFNLVTLGRFDEVILCCDKAPENKYYGDSRKIG